MAACENMIDGRATRPGDILTAANGKTVEVNNTDAEASRVWQDLGAVMIWLCLLMEAPPHCDVTRPAHGAVQVQAC